MKKFMTAAAAACIAFSGAAHASPISISAFDITSFDDAVGFNDFVVEDFEALGGSMGEGWIDGGLGTDVGTFSSLGGFGSGSTCDGSGEVAATGAAGCENLALFQDDINSQDNLVPDDGHWSLNANDTLGIQWDVVKGVGSSVFNRIVFAMSDAADQGATVRVDIGGGIFEEISGQSDGNAKLIVIDFATGQDSATITITTALNDSLSIDGASVGVVPLPAGGLLLLTGLGAIAMRRRRKAA